MLLEILRHDFSKYWAGTSNVVKESNMYTFEPHYDNSQKNKKMFSLEPPAPEYCSALAVPNIINKIKGLEKKKKTMEKISKLKHYWSFDKIFQKRPV